MGYRILQTGPLENDGHTCMNSSKLSWNTCNCLLGFPVKFTVDESVGASISGGPLTSRYILAQFHLHWGSRSGQGSEHTIDGRRLVKIVCELFYICDNCYKECLCDFLQLWWWASLGSLQVYFWKSWSSCCLWRKRCLGCCGYPVDRGYSMGPAWRGPWIWIHPVAQNSCNQAVSTLAWSRYSWGQHGNCTWATHGKPQVSWELFHFSTSYRWGWELILYWKEFGRFDHVGKYAFFIATSRASIITRGPLRLQGAMSWWCGWWWTPQCIYVIMDL